MIDWFIMGPTHPRASSGSDQLLGQGTIVVMLEQTDRFLDNSSYSVDGPIFNLKKEIFSPGDITSYQNLHFLAHCLIPQKWPVLQI